MSDMMDSPPDHDTVGDGFEKCQRCGKKPATDYHTCPYRSEINNDDETMCNCCEECQHECGMDI